MTNASLFYKLKHLSVRTTIILTFVLFVLLFFYFHVYGYRHASLVWSIILALPLPLCLANLFVNGAGSTESSQTHLPWHQQESILRWLFFLSIFPPVVVAFMQTFTHGNFSDTVGLPIEAISLLLASFAFVRIAILRRLSLSTHNHMA
jgi:hypothetical protein